MDRPEMSIPADVSAIIKDVTSRLRHSSEFSSLLCYNVTPISNSVGSGAYGTVGKFSWKGTPCAGKKLHNIFFCESGWPNKESICSILERFQREMKIIKNLNHPNIVKFLGIHFDDQDCIPVILMELLPYNLGYFMECKIGSVENRSIVPETVWYRMIMDVARGLVYLHDVVKIAHRDLSSYNVLVTATLNAKIADLGSARVLERPGGWHPNTPLTQAPGTRCFMPAEALRESPIYDVSVDVFSMACVIIHIFTCELPLPADQTIVDEDGKFLSFLNDIERRSKYLELMGESHPLFPLVKRCLSAKSQRPTAAVLLEEVNKVAVIDESNDEIAFDFYKEIDDLKRTVQKQDQIIEDKDHTIETMQKEISEKDNEINRLRRELAQRDEDIKMLRQGKEAMQSSVKECMEARTAELSRIVQETKNEFLDTTARLQERIALLSTSLLDYSKRIEKEIESLKLLLFSREEESNRLMKSILFSIHMAFFFLMEEFKRREAFLLSKLSAYQDEDYKLNDAVTLRGEPDLSDIGQQYWQVQTNSRAAAVRRCRDVLTVDVTEHLCQQSMRAYELAKGRILQSAVQCIDNCLFRLQEAEGDTDSKLVRACKRILKHVLVHDKAAISDDIRKELVVSTESKKTDFVTFLPQPVQDYLKELAEVACSAVFRSTPAVFSVDVDCYDSEMHELKNGEVCGPGSRIKYLSPSLLCNNQCPRQVASKGKVVSV